LNGTNDPRETKSWSFGLAIGNTRLESPPKRKEIERIVKMLESATRFIQGNCKVMCTSTDDPRYEPLELSECKRGFGHSRMWAQYGGAHKGVCLIFDRSLLHEAISHELSGRFTIYHGAVDYSDDVAEEIVARALPEDQVLQHGLDAFLNMHRQRFHRTFFFTKRLDWAQEFEYRWVVIGVDDEPEYVPIEKAMAGIVVGCDFPRVYLPSLVPLCRALGIAGARIKWLQPPDRVRLRSLG
jgi:hypothetical protein